MSETSWNLLSNPDVLRTVHLVAKSYAGKNVGILELDDLEQEGLAMVATTPNLQGLARSGEFGYLYRALSQDIYDSLVRPLLRSGAMDAMRYKSSSTPEEVLDKAEPELVFANAQGGDYSPEMVAELMPAVWDETYAYGLPQKAATPDADMPRAASNKAAANNLSAFIADIKTGWVRTPLTKKERAALFLAYAMHWTHEDIAFNQDVDRSTISKRVSRALEKIAARLNGSGWSLAVNTTT